MRDLRTVVRRYYLFRATNSAGFYVPVAILFLQDRGFGLAFIGFSYAVFGFATLAAEIPTGYLGDWLGRRRSLAVGSLLRAVVLASYPLVEGATAYLALHALWATGRTFRSGTQDAWLYELLAPYGERDRFARIDGRGSTAVLATSAVTAVAGGLLYAVAPAYPFFANAALAALGLPLLATFPAVRPHEDGDDAPEDGPGSAPDDPPAAARDDTLTVREAVTVLRAQARRPAVRWLVAYAAVFHALFLVTRIYEQPALDAVGVPATGLGLLYAGFKLVSAGAAATTGWLHDRLGVRGAFGLLVPVYGLAYGAVAAVPALVVPALFLNRGVRVVVRPLRNQYLNDRLDDVGRATVLSGASMVLALAGAVARIGAGLAAPALGPVGLLPAAGAAAAIAGGTLWVVVSPVRGGDATERADREGTAPAD